MLVLEPWITMMSARYSDTEFTFYTWLTKTFVDHFLKKWDIQDPTDAEVNDFFPKSSIDEK